MKLKGTLTIKSKILTQIRITYEEVSFYYLLLLLDPRILVDIDSFDMLNGRLLFFIMHIDKIYI